jgi:signal transduction histidine kinase
MALSRPEDAALAKKALERAAAGATTVAKITGTILEFAKDRRFHVEQGGEQGDAGKRCCDIEEATQLAVGCLVRPPARDGVRLDIEISTGVMAATDSILLQQVLVNLLSNAVRAMKRSGGVLRVTGGQRHDLAWIEVTDTGPGVPAEIASRLFTSVVSGSGDDPHVPRGTGGGHGLGLLISRMLIESDGGTLNLMPSEIGARFRIEIPVVE